jgi:DNA polymerase III delta prime subunit
MTTTTTIPITFVAKYKPTNINDFQLKHELNLVLNTLFEMDDLNILLIGEPNSGKTSLLNALLNNYYSGHPPDNNIMYINNLKEQGVSFFRNEMKTFCRSHSSIFGKKKMIVVDDMDNLNEQCQQVFRNYMDKYGRNVSFITTCTNPQKIIESLQSRLHVLKISPLSEEQIVVIMDTIIRCENIQLDENAKQHILQISEHIVRNVINNLEKVYLYSMSSSEPVTAEVCKQLCSNISMQQFELYIQSFELGLREPIQILYAMHDYGYSVIDILHYFFIFVKTTALLDEQQKYQIVPIICKYITIFHKVHENIIELALFTCELRGILFFKIR